MDYLKRAGKSVVDAGAKQMLKVRPQNKARDNFLIFLPARTAPRSSHHRFLVVSELLLPSLFFFIRLRTNDVFLLSNNVYFSLYIVPRPILCY